MIMKMWSICRKKDGKPIKVDLYNDSKLVNVIGFATKEGAKRAANGLEEDEILRKIIFEC